MHSAAEYLLQGSHGDKRFSAGAAACTFTNGITGLTALPSVLAFFILAADVKGWQLFTAGAIAGGVIGSVAALAGLAAVVAFFVVRQRRQKRAVAASMGKAMSGDEKVPSLLPMQPP